jgi:hypothetical protein
MRSTLHVRQNAEFGTALEIEGALHKIDCEIDVITMPMG